MQFPLAINSLPLLGDYMSGWASGVSSWTSGMLSGPQGCPPLPAGDLVLKQYMLYPENFMWDKKRCVAYVRCVKVMIDERHHC